jgi:hypothetical protein
MPSKICPFWTLPATFVADSDQNLEYLGEAGYPLGASPKPSLRKAWY